MIVQCADCKTSFRLRAELVPPQEIQVRCARCGSVFAIDGRNADSPAPPEPAAAAPEPSQFNDIALDAPAPPAAAPPASAPPAAAAPPTPPAASVPPTPPAAEPAAAPAPSMDFEIERSPAPAAQNPAQPAGAVAMESPPENNNSATFRELDLDAKPAAEEAPAAAVDPDTQKKHDKARRLARALVSDILVYNREKRDSALQSGNLVQVLGPEIKKSWEVYKERVTPDVANDSDFFREALNEILAEGQPIF